MSKKEERAKSMEPEHITAPETAGEPVIQTIPDKFYGAALKARLSPPPEPMGSSQPQAPKAKAASGGGRRMGALPVILVILIILAGVAGGFVYFNQELLFGGASEPEETLPTPEPPTPSTPAPPPAAPTDLDATSTSPTVVQLNWTDASTNEAGFRIERRQSTTEYRAITSLPPGSNAFQDRSVEPETTYLYRVIALNEGGESPASNEVSVDTRPEPPPVEIPELPPAGLDSDSDGLTELEEPLYGTSPRDPDADKDTFLDGNEVFHLYNPASGSSVRLLESGLVKPVESAVGWTIYVPTTWRATVDADGTGGTITTGHGETFTISMEANPNHQDIIDWYLTANPGILSSQVVMIQTKSGISGLEGADLLTTYFPWNGMVLVFRYNLNDQPFVNFRQTYEMMKNSLQLSTNPVLPGDIEIAPPLVEEEAELPPEDANGEEIPEDLPEEEIIEETIPEDEIPEEDLNALIEEGESS